MSFQNYFQSGQSFEIFDPKINKDKDKNYQNLTKATPSHLVKKVFDKEIRGYVMEIEGHNTKLRFPKEDKTDLSLIQQFLCLQVFLPQSLQWNLEITITDTKKTKRRINFIPSFNKIEKKFYHVKLPNEMIKKGQWLNLCIDVHSFMNIWKGQTFRSTDTIIISAFCKLRKVFTLKQPLYSLDTSDNDPSQFQETYKSYSDLSKSLNFPAGVDYSNQIISYESIKHYLGLVDEEQPQEIEESIYGQSLSGIDTRHISTKQLQQQQQQQKQYGTQQQQQQQQQQTKKRYQQKSPINTSKQFQNDTQTTNFDKSRITDQSKYSVSNNKSTSYNRNSNSNLKSPYGTNGNSTNKEQQSSISNPWASNKTKKQRDTNSVNQKQKNLQSTKNSQLSISPNQKGLQSKNLQISQREVKTANEQLKKNKNIPKSQISTEKNFHNKNQTQKNQNSQKKQKNQMEKANEQIDKNQVYDEEKNPQPLLGTGQLRKTDNDYFELSQKFSTINDPRVFQMEVTKTFKESYIGNNEEYEIGENEIEENIEFESRISNSSPQKNNKKIQIQDQQRFDLSGSNNQIKNSNQQKQREINNNEDSSPDAQSIVVPVKKQKQTTINQDIQSPQSLVDSLEIEPQEIQNIKKAIHKNSHADLMKKTSTQIEDMLFQRENQEQEEKNIKSQIQKSNYYENHLNKFIDSSVRPFTPPFSQAINIQNTSSQIITKKNKDVIVIQQQNQQNQQQQSDIQYNEQNNLQQNIQRDQQNMLEVIFDPVLNCYYDPKTNSYYELKQ